MCLTKDLFAVGIGNGTVTVYDISEEGGWKIIGIDKCLEQASLYDYDTVKRLIFIQDGSQLIIIRNIEGITITETPQRTCDQNMQHLTIFLLMVEVGH